MNKRLYFNFLIAFVIFALLACQSAPTTVTKEQAKTDASADYEVIQHQGLAPDGSAQTADEAAQVDIESLESDAITAFTQGSSNFEITDFLPLLSSSSGYNQKWEFFLETRPIALRLKFEISNFAFSKNEGKIRGYIRTFDGDEVDYEIPISKNYKANQWSADKSKLDLNFGDDYRLSYADGEFTLTGKFEGGTFAYRIPLHAWKPQTGTVYFGNSTENVFKYGILTYQQEAKGKIVKDGQEIQVSGSAYGNHYAMTREIHYAFDELADFRQTVGDLFVEFRYYVPSTTYEAKDFGYLFVAYKGLPLVASAKIDRYTLEQWLDDENYGYQINARQELIAKDGQNKARFAFTSARVKASDPYANLPSFQRAVASRFAKPIEYGVRGDWELQLDVEGKNIVIPASGLVTITRLR